MSSLNSLNLFITLSVVGGFFLGALVLWLFLRQKLNLTKEQNLVLKENLRIQEQRFQDSLQYEKNTNEIKINSLKNSFEEKKEHLSNEFNIKEEALREKIELLENSKDRLKLEFENLANRLFEENNKKSNSNLSQVLTPFKEQLNQFGKRVNDIYSDETKQRSSLLAEIQNLKLLNNQISQDAINLTKALKGENKTQGDWGEMILSKILESTGLREGIEYSTQSSYTDENGKRLRPDVVLHLPQNKDVIIDSKVSLVSYTKYVQNEDEKQKELAAKDLVSSIQAHIKGLSLKRYEDIEDLKTLDFVLLFIPIEGAFMLAVSKEQNLFKFAFEKNIMLVSPSTLYVTLRTIENIWRYEHQNENALLISKKAADLYDKFAGFVSDMESIGANINKTQKAYDESMKKLTTGRGNLLRRSEEFIDLGVQTKKKIDSQKLLGE